MTAGQEHLVRGLAVDPIHHRRRRLGPHELGQDARAEDDHAGGIGVGGRSTRSGGSTSNPPTAANR